MDDPEDPREKLRQRLQDKRLMPKPPGERASDKDKFVLRMPAGMRDRIRRAAERSGRSMNAEVIATLISSYPEEPDIYDVMDKVHRAIKAANNVDGLPYRKEMIDALDAFSERLESGIEFQPFRHSADGLELGGLMDRFDRWRRAQEFGVDQRDLEREIGRGLMRHGRGDTVRQAIIFFREGKPDRALRLYRLHEVKFADRPAALAAIEADLQAYYEENWGDIDDDPPWETEGES